MLGSWMCCIGMRSLAAEIKVTIFDERDNTVEHFPKKCHLMLYFSCNAWMKITFRFVSAESRTIWVLSTSSLRVLELPVMRVETESAVTSFRVKLALFFLQLSVSFFPNRPSTQLTQFTVVHTQVRSCWRAKKSLLSAIYFPIISSGRNSETRLKIDIKHVRIISTI